MPPTSAVCRRASTARLLLLMLAGAQGMAVPSATPGRVAPPSQISLLTCPPDALREHFGWPQLQHAGSDKGEGIWSLLRKGIDPRAADELNLWNPNLHSPKLQQLLAEECKPVCAGVVQSQLTSSDGTEKLLVQLDDGKAVECVIIPMVGGKTTSLCISSQVGCSHACAFCSTGTMGLLRNLRAEEILAQVWLALRVIRERNLPRLVNIVFMGMGEPLNNLEQVRIAADMLVDQNAFGFSRRTVCVSTVGPSPKIIKSAVSSLPCRLAWSIHAADDTLRKLLVPTTQHSMEELRDAFMESLAAKPVRVQGLLVELALIAGINDQEEHAEQLAHLLYPFDRGKVLVNLIPYNDNGLGLRDGTLFSQPSREAVLSFQRRVWSHNLLCTVRETRGDEERSACGQLATASSSGS